MSENGDFWATRPQQNPEMTWREYTRGIMTEIGLALNPTAAFVFKGCDGAHTVTQLVDSYQAEYGVDMETARSDVKAVIEQLVEQNALVTSQLTG